MHHPCSDASRPRGGRPPMRGRARRRTSGVPTPVRPPRRRGRPRASEWAPRRCGSAFGAHRPRGAGTHRDDVEERFLGLCRAASLPTPEVNADLLLDDGSPIKVDFLWRRERLAVETDAFGTHGTRQPFERDRIRDQLLRRAGYDPVRFTRRQILKDPDRVVYLSTSCSPGEGWKVAPAGGRAVASPARDRGAAARASASVLGSCPSRTP
jgi:hypothetical protein